MIDGIAMKDKRIMLPFLLQKQIPQQLTHMGIEDEALSHELVYWIHFNMEFKKQCETVSHVHGISMNTAT